MQGTPLAAGTREALPLETTDEQPKRERRNLTLIVPGEDFIVRRIGCHGKQTHVGGPGATAGVGQEDTQGWTHTLVLRAVIHGSERLQSGTSEGTGLRGEVPGVTRAAPSPPATPCGNMRGVLSPRSPSETRSQGLLGAAPGTPLPGTQPPGAGVSMDTLVTTAEASVRVLGTLTEDSSRARHGAPSCTAAPALPWPLPWHHCLCPRTRPWQSR